MSTKNKKSVASQALLEMDSIISEIKEESKKSLNVMLSEAVKNALREGCDEDDEKDYEVIDDDKNDAKDKKEDSKKSSTSDVDEDANDEMENGVDAQQVAPQGDADTANAQMPDMGSQEAPMDAEGGVQTANDAEGGEEDAWNDASQYQVSDNTYDLTGENDYNQVVKVYKLLKDDDNVVVKSDGNTIKLQDNGAGTEYVIDLGDEENEPAEADGEEEMPTDNLNEVADIASLPDDEDDNFENGDKFDDIPNGSQPWDDDEELDVDFDDDFDNVDDDDYENDDEFDSDNLDGEEMNNYAFESKKTRKPMKESKETLFEVDLGYTDNYQAKDPIKGLSNNEPSKSGKSWHKGVPTGTSKPWAGETKSKGDPFKTTQKVEGSVNEEDLEGGEIPVEEANLSQSRWDDTHANGNRVPAANGDEYRRKGMQKTHKGNEYRATSTVAESKELKAIKKENKELKEAVLALRKNLNEAYITNVNLGKITKLFLENTTSQAEKIDIVNRFSNEAKTVEQSKALYESINRELKKTNSNPMNITESSVTAKGTKTLNEEKVYKSDDLLKTIDFMNRVLNC